MHLNYQVEGDGISATTAMKTTVKKCTTCNEVGHNKRGYKQPKPTTETNENISGFNWIVIIFTIFQVAYDLDWEITS